MAKYLFHDLGLSSSASSSIETLSVARHSLGQARPGKSSLDQWKPYLMSAVGFKSRAENYRTCNTRLVIFASPPPKSPERVSSFPKSIDLAARFSSCHLEGATHDHHSPRPGFPLLPVHLILISFCYLAAPQCLTINVAFADQLQPPSTPDSELVSRPSPLQNLLSAFDSFETLPSGKKLPKDYLTTAREVIRSLRDSLGTDSASESGFRKSADGAKTAIRNYLGSWKNSPLVSEEESYKAIEVVLREIGAFYSKKGPSAAMPADVKERILASLDQAMAYL